MSQLILNQIKQNTQSCIALKQDMFKKIKYFDEEINKINFNLQEINTKLEYIMHYIDTNKLSTHPDFEPI